MAFDLVQYFVEQIETQKPELLQNHTKEQRREYISEINALTLGKLITQWRDNPQKIYNEITHPDELYILEISRHLTTRPENKSDMPRSELEHLSAEIFHLQLSELKQLHDTANHNLNSIQQLLRRQIQHLSGQADDWILATDNPTQLKGSKHIRQEELSLEISMKQFNHMVNQNPQHVAVEAEDVVLLHVASWAQVIAPVVP